MTKRQTTDPNVFAKSVFDQVLAKVDPDSVTQNVQEPGPQKDASAVTRGKISGSKGGKTRAANLSPAKRKQIAKKAARARWGK